LTPAPLIGPSALADSAQQSTRLAITRTPRFVAFSQAVLFRGADITLAWRPLVAMLSIGAAYCAVAQARRRRIISAANPPTLQSYPDSVDPPNGC